MPCSENPPCLPEWWIEPLWPLEVLPPFLHTSLFLWRGVILKRSLVSRSGPFHFMSSVMQGKIMTWRSNVSMAYPRKHLEAESRRKKPKGLTVWERALKFTTCSVNPSRPFNLKYFRKEVFILALADWWHMAQLPWFWNDFFKSESDEKCVGKLIQRLTSVCLDDSVDEVPWTWHLLVHFLCLLPSMLFSSAGIMLKVFYFHYLIRDKDILSCVFMEEA